MYVVVIGMGEVGRHIVRTLEQDRHDIVAIDHDKTALSEVEEHHDVMTLCGYGASRAVLEQARAGEADLVVAVSSHDEVNLLGAIAARELGAKQTLARVQSRAWADTGDGSGIQHGLFGVDVVFNPHVLLAQEIVKIATSHGALEVIDVASRRIEVVQLERPANNRMLHKTLSKLALPHGVNVAAIVREGELRVPGGTDVLLPGDRVYLVGVPARIGEAEARLSSQRDAQRVCIVGGGEIGRTVAERLSQRRIEVMLFERDRVKARALAADLPDVTVIQGDGTSLDLLTEEGVGNCDLLVATTGEDEANLLIGLLALQVGVKRVATQVQRPDYRSIHRQLGIDIVLSPRTVASNHILRFCRHADLQSLTSLTSLEGGKAELLEFFAVPKARIVGIPIHRVGVPRGALLCAIARGDEVIIPRGDDHIQAGDTVVVLTTAASRAGMVRLFQPRPL